MTHTRTEYSTTELAFEAGTVSRVGSARAVNEDVVDVRVRNDPDGFPVGYAIVCDGLGGYEAGEIASRLAVRVIRKTLADSIPGLEDLSTRTSAVQPDLEYLRRRISEGVYRANRDIYRFSRANEAAAIPHSGTAMTLTALIGGRAVIAHIGNSRLYRYREDRLEQLTRDHTIVAELIGAGILPDRKARLHPHRNVLTRALGTQPGVQADVRTIELCPDDRLLLCSNGLWSSFPHDLGMAGILGRGLPPDQTAAALVRTARQFDGSDDLSAIVVEVRSRR